MVDNTKDGAEVRPAQIAHEAVELVQRWLAESAHEDDGARTEDPAARRLAGVLGDPDGLDFAVGFVNQDERFGVGRGLVGTPVQLIHHAGRSASAVHRAMRRRR